MALHKLAAERMETLRENVSGAEHGEERIGLPLSGETIAEFEGCEDPDVEDDLDPPEPDDYYPDDFVVDWPARPR